MEEQVVSVLGELTIRHCHERMLYPCVRVRAQKAGGSGTIIYSSPDPHSPDEYITLVLTNHHVVDDLIQIKEQWDSVLQRMVKRDILAEAKVETFEYHRLSTVVSANSHSASIIAYDKEHDLAILRLHSPKPYPHVARLIPRDRISDLRLFTPICCVGCSLLHDPIPNFGYITGLREIIENKTYMMQSAHSIFGNSGGAVYTADENAWLLGVPSRITAIQLGFGIDVVTWMGFFCHPERLYQFLDEQELHFIYDPSDNFYSAMERRERKREQERMRMAQVSSESEL